MQAPNFVWKTTEFPAARTGYLWSIVLQILLVVVVAAIQLLLWRDKRIAAKAQREGVPTIVDGTSPELQGSDFDETEKRVSRSPDIRSVA